MPNYHKLYTPQDSALIFIDHQPQMIFGVSNIDRSLLINKYAYTIVHKAPQSAKVAQVVKKKPQAAAAA
jgi:nicotinamidase-related amidase